MQVRDFLRTAKTDEGPKHHATRLKLLSSRSAKRTKDDNYSVEESSTGRQHHVPTHVASPLLSRRVRSQSVDRARSPIAPSVTKDTALSLPSHTGFDLYCRRPLSQSSPAHSHSVTSLRTSSSRGHCLSSDEVGVHVSSCKRRHPNESSVSYNILS